MTAKSWCRAVAAAAALLACAPGVADAAPFTNGSFEDANGPRSFVTTLDSGSTAIPGWTVSAGNVNWLNRVIALPATDGKRNVDLNGNKAGAISQTFDTIPGARYTVTFRLSHNPLGGALKGKLDVSADGQSESYVALPLVSKAKTFQFVADDTSATLTFASGTRGCGGPILDDVAVSTAASQQLLDSRSASNAAPATLTTGKLKAGQAYTVKARGTFSSFATSLMAVDGVRTAGWSVCGPPEAAPLIPSVGVENGRVGGDPEFLFAYPQLGEPCNPRSEALLPVRQSALLFSTDNGATWAAPVARDNPAAPAAGHGYAYGVTGTGQALQVRFADRALTDNYGQFEITVLED